MKRLLPVLLLALAIPSQAAVEVDGVSFAETAQLGSSTLQLNGAGTRSRFFIKVYAMGLYLPEKQSTPAAILAANGPKRIQIVLMREVGAEKLADALVEGIGKNHSESEMAPLKARIEEMRAAMLALKEIPKGAVILLDWVPETGTHLTFNGQSHSRDIPGEDFYRALLKIWLGEKPPAEDLKEALLGRPR
jgi:hypothetical protein